MSGEEIHGNDVEGVLAFKKPWPSMARTVWGAHKRYMDTYLNVYKGYYFSGDGAGRDHEGYYWIRGRVDDVVNVSGHRLSTAEIEAALIEHHQVAEAAVVGINDELTGQAVNAFVSLKEGNETNDDVKKDLVLQVRKSIGPFAAPKAIFMVDDLPKTRSGKIMRRILRKILSGEEDSLGDTSTVRLFASHSCGPSLSVGCSCRIRAWLIKSLRLYMHPRKSERSMAYSSSFETMFGHLLWSPSV